ncbi:MAG: hypothetical protein A2268_11570 [Candidatus Raymondbacteria bacterium RifOxyA12_full_50_37]|uniref:Type II secretion system protein GspF domain-containing protein n=1 Tax=Candidatus Raymondbacteria bacterium RIFOXYD12_FULL_49_13 TaxID=1817890 RepID=A0A1F7F3P6_UNCRA|nr:MAG: hypothetical protein A2268_11570 [Candidatus Raymondbacteria bacterium RifOxyA12_full_50_37]OGJ85976.1 MAG: hypothetical protein A2248_00405 [Candidatus Raymondbacteria bacterium RIFOXYA2_FULL_49_16]OGJ90082.1 MAG: hypothetical protein A2350_07945 [Candidatus Raymondbacteria bacterium RifOxyB12_full_50_8]OGJ97142.1 MAG: hypothetical protein A2453_12515 [Candidatus Raymondbacteria bacterium RIFOXYC2_FULL_50_21]OGK01157.1 MAG: hypothetical protein A2519_01380 [Candidatus Raymondbacteria b
MYYGALILLFISIGLLVYIFVPALRDWVEERQARLLKKAEAKTDELYIRIDSRKMIRTAVLVSLCFGLLIGMVLSSMAGGIVACGIGLAIPYFLTTVSQRRRRRELDRILPGALEKAAASLRAGGSLQSAFEQIAERSEGPFSQEITHLLQEVGLGLSMDEALRRMAQRVKSDDVSTVCTAISITLQTGGNLSSMLESIAQAIQERRTLDGKVRSLTSQGKMQGIIIGLLPAALLAVFCVIDYQMIRPLFETAPGRLMLGAGVLLELTGLLMIKKIVDIKY